MRRNNHFQLKVVSTPEEQLQAFAIRTLVYIGEQNCPWAEEFDCNDFTATQILGSIDGEPVATARIRWFGSFAKLERLAIRAEHRGTGHGCRLLEFLMDLCREKGFPKAYLHAQARLQPFYERYGFVRIGEPFSFSDHEYVEMVATLSPRPGAKSLEDGPHCLNRPEGRWDEVGLLERSALRSRPHEPALPMPCMAARQTALIPSYR